MVLNIGTLSQRQYRGVSWKLRLYLIINLHYKVRLDWIFYYGKETVRLFPKQGNYDKCSIFGVAMSLYRLNLIDVVMLCSIKKNTLYIIFNID